MIRWGLPCKWRLARELSVKCGQKTFNEMAVLSVKSSDVNTEDWHLDFSKHLKLRVFDQTKQKSTLFISFNFIASAQ